MRTRRIGPLEVSLGGLGCNNFGRRIDAAQAEVVVHAALERGVTLFDTADIYGRGQSEELLGRALGPRRDEAVIATKFGGAMDDERTTGGASPDWIRRAVDDSLRRLGTDRIDLYQLHFPDQNVPLAETMGALHELVEAGKVRAIGCSNFDAGLIDESMKVTEQDGLTPFVSVQNQWNLLDRQVEDGVVEACERHALAVLPYFPLAMGLLTGKYRRGQPLPDGARLTNMSEDRRQQALTDERFEVVEALERFARQRGRDLLELAIGWLAGQPVVASVIAGATRPEQVEANVAALSWRLTADELAEIDRITGRG